MSDKCYITRWAIIYVSYSLVIIYGGYYKRYYLSLIGKEYQPPLYRSQVFFQANILNFRLPLQQFQRWF